VAVGVVAHGASLQQARARAGEVPGCREQMKDSLDVREVQLMSWRAFWNRLLMTLAVVR
jgi:hypothetical protein